MFYSLAFGGLRLLIIASSQGNYLQYLEAFASPSTCPIGEARLIIVDYYLGFLSVKPKVKRGILPFPTTPQEALWGLSGELSTNMRWKDSFFFMRYSKVWSWLCDSLHEFHDGTCLAPWMRRTADKGVQGHEDRHLPNNLLAEFALLCSSAWFSLEVECGRGHLQPTERNVINFLDPLLFLSRDWRGVGLHAWVPSTIIEGVGGILQEEEGRWRHLVISSPSQNPGSAAVGGQEASPEHDLEESLGEALVQGPHK